MPEQGYNLEEPVEWKSLSGFRDRCNQVLGRNAVVSVGSDGYISAIDLTPAEIATIKEVNRYLDRLDLIESSKSRNLTLAEVETLVDNATTILKLQVIVKTLVRKAWWTDKREMNEL